MINGHDCQTFWQGDQSFQAYLQYQAFEILSLCLHAKPYSWVRPFDRPVQWRYRSRLAQMRRGLIVCHGASIRGSGSRYHVLEWTHHRFGPLRIPGWIQFWRMSGDVGAGIIFSSLFISAMFMKRP